MSERDEYLDELLSSLLYEGYSLYPYTPGATKNATPTPFGIVYPPAYANENPSTFDRLQVECVLESEAGAELDASLHFLQASGPRHQAVERRVTLPAVPVESLEGQPSTVAFAFESDPDVAEGARVEGTALLAVGPVADGARRVTLRVENQTALDDEDPALLGRAEALRRSLLSTHVVVHTSAGHFVSPLERAGPRADLIEACDNVNTWPVLATSEDDAILGAAIMLPDHPELAPESRGNLFDNTEIEEALLLHVHTLSDAEREEIGSQDAAVREMVERAGSATPEDLLRLHGRMRLTDPSPVADPRPLADPPLAEPPLTEPPTYAEPPTEPPIYAEPPTYAEPSHTEPALHADPAREAGGEAIGEGEGPPPRPPGAAGLPNVWGGPVGVPRASDGATGLRDDPSTLPGGASDLPGEEEAVVEGVTFRRGSKVLLRPGEEGDPFDRMLHGRVATIERIYLDPDDKVYLAVTVDDDPGREILRDTGRYLFFFAPEVELVEP